MQTAKRKVASKTKRPEIKEVGLCDRRGCTCRTVRGVALGVYHTWGAALSEPSSKGGATMLRVGCRTFRSPTAAKAHWKGGKSQISWMARPRAAELIAKAAATAKLMRWRWGAKAKA